MICSGSLLLSAMGRHFCSNAEGPQLLHWWDANRMDGTLFDVHSVLCYDSSATDLHVLA